MQDASAALVAVKQVQRLGGVLEHPAHSNLFKRCRLPVPGQPSLFAPGFTIEIDQSAFGHACQKRTWLYAVGIDQFPELPPSRKPTAVIAPSRNNVLNLPQLKKSDRHLTPVELAKWLLQALEK